MEDEELRIRFDEWTRPLRAAAVPEVGALRRRIRRRMARLAAAVGAALAVIGVVAGSLVASGRTGLLTHHTPPLGPSGSAKYLAPPGQPYVFVNSSDTFVNVGNIPTTPAEIKDAATGKVIKVLRPIGQGTNFTGAAAVPGDRAFVLAQQDSNDTTSFVEIRIGASGTAGALRPVLPGVSLPAGIQLQNLTVNASITRLSFVTFPQYGPGGGSLVVYNLLAGTLIGSWSFTGNNFANSQFVGYGNELVASFSSVGQGQIRLVDTSAAFRPGSSLLADSRPGPAGDVPGYLTQNGNMSLVPEPPNSGPVLLMEYSAAGKLLRKLPMGQASGTNGPYFCGVLWASANGGELFTQCGTEQLIIIGSHVTRVRLAWLLPSDAGSSGTFAW